MILAALVLIALLAVSLIVSVALLARDVSIEQQALQAAETRLPVSV